MKTTTAEQTNEAYAALEAHLRYNDELQRSEELASNEFRSHTFAELAALVGKSEEEIRSEFEANGTLF